MKTCKKGGYRSGLEKKIAKLLTKLKAKFTYESERIKYIYPAQRRTYTPDFILTTRSGKIIYIEVKGRWKSEDRQKHLLIKQQFPGLDIRFVFGNADNKIRKQSTTTYRDICEGKGHGPYKTVRWRYAEGTVPKEWLEE